MLDLSGNGEEDGPWGISIGLEARICVGLSERSNSVQLEFRGISGSPESGTRGTEGKWV